MSYKVTKYEDKTAITYEWSKRSKVLASFFQISLLAFLFYYSLNNRGLMPETIIWPLFFFLLLSLVFYKKQFYITNDQTFSVVKRLYSFKLKSIKGNLADYNFKHKVNYHKKQIMDLDGGMEASLGNAKTYTSNLILINRHRKHRNINIYAVNSSVKGYRFKRTCEYLEKTYGIEVLGYYKR